MNGAVLIPIDLREAVVAPALAKLAEQQAPVALSILGAVTGNYAAYASAVLGAIAKSDPRRAWDWAVQNADRDPGGEVMRALLPDIAPTYLDTAARAIAAMGDRAPVPVIQQVAAEYAMRDPQQAYTWALSFAQTRPAAAVDEIVSSVSAALAAHGPDDAAVFLNEATDPRIRASLIREIANRKSETDLREAWGWLSQYSADASYPENARNLLYRWAYLRPEEVASILRDVTDTEMRVAVARELASQWQRRDSVAYQTWVAALPAGPLRSAVAGAGQ